MNFRIIIAAVLGLRNRGRQTTLEAPDSTKQGEINRISDLFVCPMVTSNEASLDKLNEDAIIYILNLLDTPRDVACAACVCSSWRRYVIEGKLWKKMCVKLFPEIGSNFKLLNHSDGFSHEHKVIKQSKYSEAESSACELLLRRLLRLPRQRTCISESLHASSTDNFPQESVVQTLYPEPEYSDTEIPSYWSSTGQGDTSVPEVLTYRLVSDLCVVHTVKIRPYLAHFQRGHPIYSSQMVRFRFGYSRVAKPIWSGLLECFSHVPGRADMGEYVWTYVSPTFQMAQEDTLQTFQLPKRTVCVGGIFQIELLGRVQTQESDGLYYICIGHVHVTGRPLSDFKFEGVDNEGKIVLKYLSPKKRPSSSIRTLGGSDLEQSGAALMEQIRLNRIVMRNGLIVNMLLQYLSEAGLLEEGVSEDDELL